MTISDLTISNLTLALPSAITGTCREGRAPVTCSEGKTLHQPRPAQRDLGFAQAGVGGRDAQQGKFAEAPT